MHFDTIISFPIKSNMKEKKSAIADLLTVRVATLLYGGDSADGGNPGMFSPPLKQILSSEKVITVRQMIHFIGQHVYAFFVLVFFS